MRIALAVPLTLHGAVNLGRSVDLQCRCGVVVPNPDSSIVLNKKGGVTIGIDDIKT